MTGPRQVWGLVAVTVVLTACTGWGPGPDIAGGTPNGVTVRYDAGEVGLKAVEEVAVSYCRGFDKLAWLRSRFAAGPAMTYADYDCVPPFAAGI
ncbi:MAG: hypothetical protein M0006_03770 [Magnetospirillum sp.]|nr:hypothetical protein [Magnetospirillum sp.]